MRRDCGDEEARGGSLQLLSGRAVVSLLTQLHASVSHCSLHRKTAPNASPSAILCKLISEGATLLSPSYICPSPFTCCLKATSRNIPVAVIWSGGTEKEGAETTQDSAVLLTRLPLRSTQLCREQL